MAPENQGRANLGRSLMIKGEVTGNEDLTIDGTVDGTIHLDDHDLTIGENSKVNAEIRAKNITIFGNVTGDMIADEKVTLTDSGKLQGNIKAPRIAISDGAQFRGSIDMGTEPARQAKVLRDTPSAPVETGVRSGHGVQAGKTS